MSLGLLMQFQADLLGTKVCRPKVAETTALGAAFLAGLAVGYWNGLEELAACWQLDREFNPAMADKDRDKHYAQWQRAVNRSLGWVQPE